jgi:ComF family protein
MTAMRVWLHELAEGLLPQRCVACERFGAALHPECVGALPAADGPRCLRCWSPMRTAGSAEATGGTCARCHAQPPACAGLRTPFRFEGAARRAVLEAKFRGITAVLPPLAAAAEAVVPHAWGVTAVVAVPLHRRRERQRGYNQAAIIAAEVAARLGVSAEPGWLRRVRATQPQAGLDAAKRARNLEGAFQAGGVSGRVLLVDDVTTTGATFEAAARALRAGGAVEVFAVAIARED